MFQKIAKHRANDASNDVHRPPPVGGDTIWWYWVSMGRYWLGVGDEHR